MDLCCWLLGLHWTSEDKAQAIEGRLNPFMYKTNLKSKFNHLVSFFDFILILQHRFTLW